MPATRKPLRTAAAALTLLALPTLAACNSTSNAAPKPSATTSASAMAGSVSPSASPSSASSAALAQEADATYRAVLTSYKQVVLSGGLAVGQKPPAGLTDNATGQGLKDEVTELNQVHQLGLKRLSGDIQIVKTRVSSKARADSIIAMDVCEDGRSFVTKASDGVVGHGDLVYRTNYFTMVSGKLKMNYYDGKVVTKCPIA